MFAQALTAASHTVAADRIPHSIHGHFLRPGRPEVPIAFRVERDRDGASFSSRRVAAYQEEVLVFTLGASFHPAEAGFAHQEDMRSEEHTSELQSLMRISYAVFCLKKKIKNDTNAQTN